MVSGKLSGSGLPWSDDMRMEQYMPFLVGFIPELSKCSHHKKSDGTFLPKSKCRQSVVDSVCSDSFGRRELIIVYCWRLAVVRIFICKFHNVVFLVKAETSASSDTNDERKCCADYTCDLGPLHMAAQYDHYDIVNLLLSRGHTIAKPHPASCTCDLCFYQSRTQKVRSSFCNTVGHKTVPYFSSEKSGTNTQERQSSHEPWRRPFYSLPSFHFPPLPFSPTQSRCPHFLISSQSLLICFLLMRIGCKILGKFWKFYMIVGKF